MEAFTSHQDSQWSHLVARLDRFEHLLEGLVGKCASSAVARGLPATGGAPDDGLVDVDPPGHPQTENTKRSNYEGVIQSIAEQGRSSSKESQEFMNRSREKLVRDDVRSHWRHMVKKAETARLETFSGLPIVDKLYVPHAALAPLGWMLQSRQYEFFITFVVLLNTVMIGWQTQYAAVHHHPPAIERVSENVFCVIYVLELVARLLTQGSHFCSSTDCRWNLFDSVVVAAMMFERILKWAYDGPVDDLSDVSMFRIMRIARVLRIFNVLRVTKFLRELRMMIQSILHSAKSLFWVALILTLLFYVFGITLVQGVVSFCSTEGKWDSRDTIGLREHFGTLDRSFLSLFEGMSGGISWGELLDILESLPSIYTYIFLSFISFAIFGVVNIVTAVFIDTALQCSEADRNTMVQEEILQKEKYAKRIVVLFQELDIDKSGVIGFDEFEKAVQDSQVVALINALGLDITDIRTLFVLLDRDRSGAIDIEEFLVGCMRLQGGAKALDLIKLQMMQEFLVESVNELTSNVRALLTAS